TQLGFMPTIAVADIRADITKIKCPTLVITTEDSGLGSVAAMRAWQEQIAGSELVVWPGNSYHVAATHADESADATVDFLKPRGLPSPVSGLCPRRSDGRVSVMLRQQNREDLDVQSLGKHHPADLDHR